MDWVLNGLCPYIISQKELGIEKPEIVKCKQTRLIGFENSIILVNLFLPSCDKHCSKDDSAFMKYWPGMKICRYLER